MNFNKMLKNMFWQDLKTKIFGTKTADLCQCKNTRRRYPCNACASGCKRCDEKVHPELLIGLSLSLHDIQAVDGGDAAAKHEWEEEFTHYLPYIKDDDFWTSELYQKPYWTRWNMSCA